VFLLHPQRKPGSIAEKSPVSERLAVGGMRLDGGAGMKYVVLTDDAEVADAASKAFQHDDAAVILSDWRRALDEAVGADLFFVDLLATLNEPHKIAGYEEFAEAKMVHACAKTPLALIWPPEGYELDFMTGYPDFIFQHVRRPVTYQKLRRASTYL
jgi:hypothetical protein